jgi:hypothetical protein
MHEYHIIHIIIMPLGDKQKTANASLQWLTPQAQSFHPQCAQAQHSISQSVIIYFVHDKYPMVDSTGNVVGHDFLFAFSCVHC